MYNEPKTRAEAEKYRYGAWAGFPQGRAYDPKCCAYEVFEGGRSIHHHQCLKKPGHGPEGLYCKQHDPATREKRATDRNQAFEKDWARKQEGWARETAMRELCVDVDTATLESLGRGWVKSQLEKK